jgi:hypothetical protein
VLTANEASQARQGFSDAQVLAFAISQTRAVITFNRRHFIRLHRHVQPHYGIIVCTDDRDWIALAARVHQAIGALPKPRQSTRPHQSTGQTLGEGYNMGTPKLRDDSLGSVREVKSVGPAGLPSLLFS